MTLFAGKGAFVANAVYTNPRAYGDLANMGNLPNLREYHREVFHTDAAGFRNRHVAVKPFNGVLLVGHSYAAGAGVSDEDSLGQQIAQLSNVPVYNAAWGEDALNQVPMGCGLVVWEQSERWDIPLAQEPELGWKGRTLRRMFGERGRQQLRSFYFWADRYAASWSMYSPAAIWSTRLIKSVQDDRILPNPYRHLVASRTLINGQQMLFLPSEVANYQLDRDTDPTFFVRLRARLNAHHIELLVLLVPDKYVVYHDLFWPSENPQRAPHRLFTDRLAQRLAAARVPVVNLTPTFRARAVALLARNSYLYRIDDTHWNEAGIHEAAVEIVSSGVFPKTACSAAAETAQ